MADILTISTPISQRNEVQQTRPASAPGAAILDPKNINLTKVNAYENEQSINQKFSGLDPDGKPTILMNMMKDPAVTVTFLKNIYMLREIIKLLPMNTRTKTAEIEQLFSALLLDPKDISKELKKQETSSSSFKGTLFDFLRSALSENSSDKMKYGVANLLKALNYDMSRKDILGAISNNLKYLADNLSASKNLSEKLNVLSNLFSGEDAVSDFSENKQKVLTLLEEIEGSILYSQDTSKLVSIINYNLSRYNTNKDFLMEAIRTMLTFIDGKEQKNQFLSLIHNFINEMQSTNTGGSMNRSQIMEILASIIGKCADSEEFVNVSPESIDKIIHSLLSSPCNYTPLLHFIIPVEYLNMKSFAEIWLNPNSEDEDGKGSGNKNSLHMLIVFDIEGIGQFETELFIDEKDKKISLVIFCPKDYREQFSRISPNLREAISFSQYAFNEIKFEEMKEPRSLIQVFKSLPYRRTGVDVRV
ncbi:MAG: antitoxin [Ruminococcus sp.]|jgi:hypothetical protein|nr:antitoxin [Ruminococcus sp.]